MGYGFAVRNGARELLGAIPEPLSRRLDLRRERAKTRIPLAQLDARIDEARALMDRSADEGIRFLAGFDLEIPSDRPEDPFSKEYREWVWSLYRAIARREDYEVGYEISPFDLDKARRRPYPYETQSPHIVGDQLIARGFILKALGLHPPARVVEFGCGWGSLTIDMALMGLDVTGVEVDPNFCTLVKERYGDGDGLTIVQADMLDFAPPSDPGDRFDAAVFFESFHHCSDHLAMLDRLHDLVKPDGIVIFAAEPINAYDYPWGPRLDGQSLWSTRVYGWLELGFDREYFAGALKRSGWSGNRLRSRSLSPLTDVIVARCTRGC